MKIEITDRELDVVLDALEEAYDLRRNWWEPPASARRYTNLMTRLIRRKEKENHEPLRRSR